MQSVLPKEHMNCCDKSDFSFIHPDICSLITSWNASSSVIPHSMFRWYACWGVYSQTNERNNRPNQAAGTTWAIRKSNAKWSGILCTVSAGIHIWESLTQQVGTSIKVQGTGSIWSRMVCNWRYEEQDQPFREIFKGVRKPKAKYPGLDQHSVG